MYYTANLTILMSDRIGIVGDFNIKSALTFWASYTFLSRHNITRDDLERQVSDEQTFSRVSITVTESLKIKLVPFFELGGSRNCPYFNFSNNFSRVRCVDIQRNKWFDENKNQDYYTDASINLRSTLTCRSVRFTKANYSVEIIQQDVPPTVTVSVDLKVTNLTFTKSSELSRLEIDEHGVMKVCAELLEMKWQEGNQSEISHPGKAEIVDVANILTLVCVAASMICLMLTLMTYIRLPILRNTAGKNTIFLCVSLLLAQGSLLTSSHL